MKKTIRTLTDREKELIAPFLQRHLEAQQVVQRTGRDLTIALQLAEPRFSEPGTEFDPAKLEFFQMVAPTPAPPPPVAIPLEAHAHE